MNSPHLLPSRSLDHAEGRLPPVQWGEHPVCLSQRRVCSLGSLQRMTAPARVRILGDPPGLAALVGGVTRCLSRRRRCRGPRTTQGTSTVSPDPLPIGSHSPGRYLFGLSALAWALRLWYDMSDIPGVVEGHRAPGASAPGAHFVRRQDPRPRVGRRGGGCGLP